MDSEEKKTPVRETSSPVPEIEIEKEEANIEITPIQQITMETETEEELQVAEEIQAREEEIEEEAEEITEEERVTQQLKETDEPVTTVEDEEEDDDEEEGEEETQCLSQKNNSDHQYFSGDFGKIQTKETVVTEKDSDDDDEEGDEEEEQSQVEPSSLIAPVPAASAQELDVITHSNINLDHPVGEDEEEEEDDERDDASDKDSPTVVIELGSEGEEDEDEEEEDDGEEEEADEVDDDELDSMSQRSEVTDDSETYDMTRGNLGLLEQAIALKAEQNGHSSEESCSPEQQHYYSPEERMSKAMDITARRAYYGKGDRKFLFQPTLIVTLYDLD